jgi:hypothetical protein
MPRFRYRLFLADGTDVGEATYALIIKPDEISHVAGGGRVSVLALVPCRRRIPASRLGVERGDYNIDREHLADAIEGFTTRSCESLSDDRSARNAYGSHAGVVGELTPFARALAQR